MSNEGSAGPESAGVPTRQPVYVEISPHPAETRVGEVARMEREEQSGIQEKPVGLIKAGGAGRLGLGQTSTFF